MIDIENDSHFVFILFLLAVITESFQKSIERVFHMLCGRVKKKRAGTLAVRRRRRRAAGGWREAAVAAA